jgi:hypothetical protein
MQAGGDILVTQKENGQDPFYIDEDLTGSSGTVHIKAGRVNFQIFVQKITVAFVTHADGKTITFQDTAGTPVVIGVINDKTAAAGVPDVVTFDFGPHGTALTVDKGFDVVVASSGSAARVHVEGYLKLKTVFSIADQTVANSSK